VRIVNPPVEILIVEPHPAMRRSLRATLDAEPGINVAAVTGDVITAFRMARRPGVSVVVLDGGLAGLGTPDGAGALARLARRVPVIVAGMGEPELYAAPYAAAGASGYWPKYGELATLVELLRSAAAPRRAAA
jgi:two-component system nitrate/nitrite response regulator NarP